MKHSNKINSPKKSKVNGQWSNVKRGFITLVSIFVIGAVGIAITVSIILLGLGSSKSSFSIEQSYQSKALANACTEEALQQIRVSSSFTGSGNIAIGQGTCDYTVTSQGAENRTVTASGTVGTIVRKVKVIISAISPVINATSWQEVSDF